MALLSTNHLKNQDKLKSFFFMFHRNLLRFQSVFILAFLVYNFTIELNMSWFFVPNLLNPSPNRFPSPSFSDIMELSTKSRCM